MTEAFDRLGAADGAKTVSAGPRHDNISYLLFTFARLGPDLLAMSVAGPVDPQQFFDHEDGYGPA